ncbi:MAG TPA: alpha/beta fold hydrolase [Candidatus Dormibacteraeota bacterium]
MKRALALATATVLALLASPAQAVTASNPYGGPPPAHAFGPDSTSTGAPYTGQGSGTQAGLSCQSATTPVAMNVCTGYLASSVDGTLLDTTVEVPTNPNGIHPLIAVMHGWGGDKNSDLSWDANFLSDGYTVLRYSARGFGNSWGQTNLADQNVEIADMRSLIGQVVDNPQLRADASRVAVIGASYGGGHSTQLLEQPSWTSPGGQAVHLKTAVPIVPWTSLYYALEPNGRPHQTYAVPGSAKLSYITALFAGGHRSPSTARPYDPYPPFLNGCLADGANEPSFSDPVYMTCLNALEGYRSLWESQQFWSTAASNRVPILDVQGWTDDLFPPPEVLRLYYALKTIDPSYPIALYLGNVGHPRAANSAAETAYLLDQVVRPWFAFYLNGTGSAPALDVKAATTQPDNSFSAAGVVEVPTYDALATRLFKKHFRGSQVITFNPANTSGVAWDPVVMTGSEMLKPNPPAPPADEAPGDVASYSVKVSDLTGGVGLYLAGAPALTLNISTTAYREQLDTRVFDVAPDGSRKLVTRGTYTLDSGSPAQHLGDQRLTLTAYGNLWQLPAGDTLLIELTNVDSPYISPSKIPSVTTLSGLDAVIPAR